MPLMPTYMYMCSDCGPFELTHSMVESLNSCPYCDKEIRKVYGNVGISFKGSGFYSTDKGGKGSD